MRKVASIFFLSLFLTLNVCAVDNAAIESRQLIKSSCSWNGQELPAYPEGEPQITILRIKIPAGAKLPMHKHPAINAGILIKANLTVITESGKVLELKAGDPIIEVVETWHYGQNKDDGPAEIIVFYAGAKKEPITIIKE
ncbi:MAG: cupin domain-containing protein [Candidatus Omnitrophica bacterium]|nr:cupin domain-containing protein [Candidatus Omnitrophota bacterium]